MLVFIRIEDSDTVGERKDIEKDGKKGWGLKEVKERLTKSGYRENRCNREKIKVE